MALQDRRRAERIRRLQEQLDASRRRAGRRRALRNVALALVVAGAVGATVGLAHGQTPSGATAATAPLGPEGMPVEAGPALAPVAGAAAGGVVDGITCDATEQVAYHVHAHLAVFVNGRPRAIPAGIGVVQPVLDQTPAGVFAQASRCYYWLHTHAADGVVHIESPTATTYTLGQFFDIWRQPLAVDQVGPDRGKLTVYVDGKRFSGDPRQIPLTAHEAIQLDVGGPTVGPVPVDWAASRL
jgi:hypothetical protein